LPAWLRRPSRPEIAVAILALITVGGIAIGTWNLVRDEEPDVEAVFEPGREQLPARPSVLARYIPPAARSARIPGAVVRLADRLSLEDKVAQLFIFSFEGRDATSPVMGKLARMNLGGLLFRRRNFQSAVQLRALTDEMLAVVRRARHVNPLFAVAQEGAEFRPFPGLPPEFAPADLQNPQESASSARDTGDVLRDGGINTILAPDVDVGPEDGGAVGARAFSDDAQEVADFATAQVRGFRETGVLAVAKHFPGLGGGSQPTEEGPSTVGFSLKELRERDLVPFRAAIRAGVPAILVGHGVYPIDDFVRPASLSPTITTDLLRGELGFNGAVIADDLAAPAITATRKIPRSAVDAVSAGADMVILSGLPSDQDRAYAAVLRAARRGEISERRLNEAVRHSLVVRRELGFIR
jgi:beta-N-acetylhexosaminidase